MTRKHYELLAHSMRTARPTGNGDISQWRFTVVCVADDLARDNPRFDTERFLTACDFNR